MGVNTDFVPEPDMLAAPDLEFIPGEIKMGRYKPDMGQTLIQDIQGRDNI